MIRDNKFDKTKQNIFSLFKVIIICCILIISNNKISYGTEAKFDGIGRVRNCEKASDSQIVVEPINGIGFDGGKDAEFVFTNEVCRTIAITSYADVKISIAAMNGICKSGSAVPRIFPSIVQDARDLVRATKSAVGNTACAVGLGNAMRSYTTALVSFGVVNTIAKAKFSSVKICGSGWKKPNPEEYLINSPGIEQEIDIYIKNQLASGNVNLNMSDVKYRQFVYGGEEVEDYTDQGEICEDATQDKLSNGSYPKQKYYLRGSQPGNFNCQKYLVSTGQDKNGAKLTTERF